LNRHILLLTGSAPYLGGPSTWKPLREAAPDLEFKDLDLLAIPPGDGYTPAVKDAIKTAAEGAGAIVAHGASAATVLETVREFCPATPVMLLSPVAITKDSSALLGFRMLLRGPLGKIITSVAVSKRGKLLDDTGYLRKQLALIVRDDAITPEILHEARQRVADPRMEAFCAHTAGTLLTVLTPTDVFERFQGPVLFGKSPMDRKAHRRIAGTVLESAWSSPMLEAPKEVADHLYALLARA